MMKHVFEQKTIIVISKFSSERSQLQTTSN